MLLEIQNMFWKFLWPNGKHHVKKNVITNKTANGGLNMPDITCMNKSLRLLWIKRILDSTKNVHFTAKHILKVKDLDVFLKRKLNLKFINPLPDFYESLLRGWYEINNREPKCAYEILEEDIFYSANKRISS